MHLSFQEKYAHIIKNSHLLNAFQQKIMAELGELSKCCSQSISPEQSPSLYAQSIKLNTIYACTIPVFMLPNMDCIAGYSNPVLFPMTAVTCFKKDQGYIVSRKCVTWIQSGGTRVVGLRAGAIENKQINTKSKGEITLSQTTISEKSKGISQKQVKIHPTAKISQIIYNTHNLIIPEHFQIDLHLFRNVVQTLKEQKDKNQPVFAIGNSALLLIYLLFLSEQEQSQQKLTEFLSICNKNTFPGQTEVYLSWQSQLFIDIALDNRLNIQNAAKIQLSANGLSISAFNAYKLDSFLKIVGLAKCKSDPTTISFMQSIEYPNMYFSFIEHYKSIQPESISLNHKIINNFIEIARRTDRKIEEKQQIQHFKLIVPEDEHASYYNIDVKLPKI